MRGPNLGSLQVIRKLRRLSNAVTENPTTRKPGLLTFVSRLMRNRAVRTAVRGPATVADPAAVRQLTALGTSLHTQLWTKVSNSKSKC